jgi:hypothetical protein
MTNMNPSRDNEPTPLTLAPADAALVDTLLEHGRPSTENLPASDRAARVHAWLKTLDASPMPEPPGDLLNRTLSRIQSERMKLDPAKIAATAAPASPAFNPRRFKFVTDLAAMTIAAGILGVVVCLGVFQARQSANRVACASNLQNFSTAFASYAANHRGDLPALASTLDTNWLNPNPAVPGSHTNAENLLPMVNAKYIQPANLICAGRDLPAASPTTSAHISTLPIPDAARGYSYVNMFAVDHPGWDGQHANIILADRNPLFDAKAPADPQSNSINHAGHGNYALRADGAVTWETSPNVGPAHDNIWTIGPGPQYQTRYLGTETPATEKDTFLAP